MIPYLRHFHFTGKAQLALSKIRQNIIFQLMIYTEINELETLDSYLYLLCLNTNTEVHRSLL